MSFLKKIFTPKPKIIAIDQFESNGSQKYEDQQSIIENSSVLDVKQADSQSILLSELKTATNEMIELNQQQPSDRGSDDQYEYEYSIYQNAYDKAINRVVEIIDSLEKVQDIDSLLTALKFKDSTVISMTALALGRIGDKRALDPLMVLLGERYSDVKIAAATALGQIGDERAVNPLVKTMLEHSESNVVNVFNAAQDALERIGKQDIVELFTSALNDDNHSYQCVAAKVLGNSGDARAVELLIASLNDGNRGVRYQAAEGLGKLKDSRAVEPLIQALHHDMTGGCSAAAKALGEIGDERALEPLMTAFPGWYEYDKWIVQEAINKIRFKK